MLPLAPKFISFLQIKLNRFDPIPLFVPISGCWRWFSTWLIEFNWRTRPLLIYPFVGHSLLRITPYTRILCSSFLRNAFPKIKNWIINKQKGREWTQEQISRLIAAVATVWNGRFFLSSFVTQHWSPRDAALPELWPIIYFPFEKCSYSHWKCSSINFVRFVARPSPI